MNPGTTIIVNLLGGVALLLWGVRMVRTGVTRGWGEQLKLFLQHRLGSRISAFLAGAAATTILGSGTATGLIVTNIAAAGGLSLAVGIAVLLGADVGSALATTIFASGISFAKQAAPLLVFVGYAVFSFSREDRPHSAGRVLIGVGLMLIALQLISQSTRPLSDASLFHDVLAAIGREPVLAFVIGAVLAWAFHSTLAAILLITSLVANGSMDVDSAAAFTRLELAPVTGRSHQLRVHLAALGHPILGDMLYAPPGVQVRASRLLLHATRLALAHPVTGKALQFDSPAPF